jgi:hypothetical protein
MKRRRYLAFDEEEESKQDEKDKDDLEKSICIRFAGYTSMVRNNSISAGGSDYGSLFSS